MYPGSQSFHVQIAGCTEFVVSATGHGDTDGSEKRHGLVLVFPIQFQWGYHDQARVGSAIGGGGRLPAGHGGGLGGRGVLLGKHSGTLQVVGPVHQCLGVLQPPVSAEDMGRGVGRTDSPGVQ